MSQLRDIGNSPCPQEMADATVLFVPSNCLGRGPSELGQRLLVGFFHALLEVTPRPAAIIFMNSGVQLVVEGSGAFEDLGVLAQEGVDVLACGTCLSFFELTGKPLVGRVSNMYDITTMLLKAGKVVSL